jgi:hypothetical protein
MPRRFQAQCLIAARRIEKRLYKLYDFRLPMPLPINWIAVFVGITVPYIVLLVAIGLPFNHTPVWLYVLPPGLLRGLWFCSWEPGPRKAHRFCGLLARRRNPAAIIRSRKPPPRGNSKSPDDLGQGAVDSRPTEVPPGARDPFTAHPSLRACLRTQVAAGGAAGWRAGRRVMTMIMAQ